MEQATSLIALLATGFGAGLAVRLILKHVHSRWVTTLIVVCFWIVFLPSWWYVDVNFPLSESRYRYGSGTPPMWLLISIWFFRFLALASVFMAFSKHPFKGRPHI